MTDTTLIDKVQEFMENEARSCSMDFGCITPEYVYRMWGGKVPLDEIEKAWLKETDGSELKVHGCQELENEISK